MCRFLVDQDFSVRTKYKNPKTGLVDNPVEAEQALDPNAKHKSHARPQHHKIKLFNSERKIKLLARNERQMVQFAESIRKMGKESVWSKPQRFDSFAPVRSGVFAQWLVDLCHHVPEHQLSYTHQLRVLQVRPSRPPSEPLCPEITESDTTKHFLLGSPREDLCH